MLPSEPPRHAGPVRDVTGRRFGKGPAWWASYRMLEPLPLHEPADEAQMRSAGVARLLHEHLELAVVSPYESHIESPIDVACARW
jgi:hypothetical protein